MTEKSSPQPAHTPWRVDSLVECPNVHIIGADGRTLAVAFQRDDHPRLGQGITAIQAREHACLMAAGPELLAACINARDMLATDRQAFVDCQRLRDSRTEDPIAHGLVEVDEGVWLDSNDAEALRDYDRAIELIDKATAKATGEPA